MSTCYGRGTVRKDVETFSGLGHSCSEKEKQGKKAIGSSCPAADSFSKHEKRP